MNQQLTTNNSQPTSARRSFNLYGLLLAVTVRERSQPLTPKPYTLNPKSGFSLMEITIFLGLFSILLVVLTSLFATLVQQQLNIESVSAVETDSKYLLSRMTYDIERADSIITPANAGDSSTSLILNIGGETVTYILDGTDLTLQTVLESNQLNSSDILVSNLSFQRLGNPGGYHSITISLDIESAIELPQGPESKTIRTTIGLR